MDNEEIEYIKQLYADGNSYKDVQKITGRSKVAIEKILKGTRSLKEAAILARKQGKGKLTAQGRLVLSDIGKKACSKRGKCWTKPEQGFKQILNELKIGVRFPEYIKEIFSLSDDENAEIYFQYPLQRYVCDYVDVDRKIVYSINGDFWHGNPLLYEEENLTKIQKFNISRDINRCVFLEKNGYKVCIIWESEIEWNKDLVMEKIRATRKLETPSVLQTDTAAFDSLVAQSDWSEKLKSLWFKKPKGRPKKIEKSKKCKHCESEFIGREKRQYCSAKCFTLSSRKVERPSAKELEKMLWEKPKQQIAKIYGVSDKAVGKWVKNYELDSPPLGYWTKKL